MWLEIPHLDDGGPDLRVGPLPDHDKKDNSTPTEVNSVFPRFPPTNKYDIPWQKERRILKNEENEVARKCSSCLSTDILDNSKLADSEETNHCPLY